jgi:hypothetical protein
MLAIEYGVFVAGEDEPRFVSTNPRDIDAYLMSLSMDDYDTALVLSRLIDDGIV